MPSFIDKIRQLFGGERAAAPDDLSRRADDEDPGASTGLDRPLPDAPPPPPD